MAYYVSTMIGIRTGGVFGESADMEKLRGIIRSVMDEFKASEDLPSPDIQNLCACSSKELSAHKGSYMIIAGVFNYWKFLQSSLFACTLSAKLGTEVMIMSWDEVCGDINCAVFDRGQPVGKPTIADVLRRTGNGVQKG